MYIVQHVCVCAFPPLTVDLATAKLYRYHLARYQYAYQLYLKVSRYCWNPVPYLRVFQLHRRI